MPEESKLAEKLDEKQSEVKFTEEELKQVQNFQVEYSNVTTKLGQLSLSKLRIRNQADAVDSEYESTINNFKKLQEDENSFLESITKKYGDGSLNPETGVFTPNKSE